MSGEPAGFSFADILAPVTEAEFFRDYHDRKPLHIPGRAEKFPAVMNRDILTRLLNISSYWTPATLKLVRDRQPLPPAAYCQTAQTLDDPAGGVLRPDPGQVRAHLEDGASLVLNDIDSMTPSLASLADALEAALDGKAQSNLYCSWKQRQAFFSHFDTHDVYAIHFEGEKVWRLYRNRMPHPIRHPRFMSGGGDFDLKNRGELMTEVTMRPGDVLYLPRGWYHDALASSDCAIHIAFGITGVIGLDAVNLLADAAINDELFRRNLPRRAEGAAALAAHLAALGDHLSELARRPDIVESFTRFLGEFRYRRGGFSLPDGSREIHYAVTPGFRVVRRENAWLLLSGNGRGFPLPPGIEDAVKWVVSRNRFARSHFTASFPGPGAAALDRLLADLQKAGVLRRND